MNLFEADTSWDPTSFSRFSNGPAGETLGEKSDYTIGDILKWDVTSTIRNIIKNGSENNGFLIIENTTASVVCNFFSSEVENEEDRPKLVIETDGANPITQNQIDEQKFKKGQLFLKGKKFSVGIPDGKISKAYLTALNGKLHILNIGFDGKMSYKSSLAKGVYFLSITTTTNKKAIHQSVIIR